MLQQPIEDASERPFGDLAAERIFAPLEMNSATFEQPIPPDLEARVARGSRRAARSTAAGTSTRSSQRRACGVGLGVTLHGTPEDPHFGHTGGNAGYRCELFASAHHGPVAAVMTNSDEGGELVPAMLNHLAPHLWWTADTREELDAQSD